VAKQQGYDSVILGLSLRKTNKMLVISGTSALNQEKAMLMLNNILGERILTVLNYI
jgi:hypothetical protein